MSDVPNAGGAAAGDEPVLPGAEEGATPAASGADTGNTPGGGLGALADDGASEPATPADWPTDWRDRMAGNNDGFSRLLKRFASPENFARSYTELQKKLAAGVQPPGLPDGATEEQVAEYRKAIGIPETPEGYGVEFSSELKGDENLNAALQSYLKFAHERNLPPPAVKAATEWYQGEILRQRSEQDAAAVRAAYEVKSQLQREYGADFKRNQTLALEWLEGYPGIKRAIEMMPKADIEVTRDLVKLVLENTPEDRLFSGDGDSGGKSLEAQRDELTQKSIRGKLTPEEDAKYNRIIGAINTRNERRQRSAA